MAIVRYGFVLLVIVMLSACSNTGPSQSAKSLPDNQDNRLVMAKRFLEIMPPKEMLQAIAKRVEPRVPEKDRKIFNEVMNSKAIEQAAYRITSDGLIKHFTVGELNAMNTFYGSPEGHSAYMKLGVYTADIMPQIQQEVKNAVLAAEKQQEPQEQQKLKEQDQPTGQKDQKNTQNKK